MPTAAVGMAPNMPELKRRDSKPLRSTKVPSRHNSPTCSARDGFESEPSRPVCVVMRTKKTNHSRHNMALKSPFIFHQNNFISEK
jgi:hypothetical protein